MDFSHNNSSAHNSLSVEGFSAWIETANFRNIKLSALRADIGAAISARNNLSQTMTCSTKTLHSFLHYLVRSQTIGCKYCQHWDKRFVNGSAANEWCQQFWYLWSYIYRPLLDESSMIIENKLQNKDLIVSAIGLGTIYGVNNPMAEIFNTTTLKIDPGCNR